ncbi:MAG TPA: hypothetical protein VM913_08380 [Sphingomicrobium sp.]|jgi:hypothetical protein|nr:hypothetical protein [Sphingomicrobium sp.]
MADPPPDEELIRRRQKSGSRVTAILLIGFVVLVFAITIVKLTLNQ